MACCSSCWIKYFLKETLKQGAIARWSLAIVPCHNFFFIKQHFILYLLRPDWSIAPALLELWRLSQKQYVAIFEVKLMANWIFKDLSNWPIWTQNFKKVLFKVSFTNILCHMNCRPLNISSMHVYLVWSKVDYCIHAKWPPSWQGPIVSGHIFISACCFGDVLRCVASADQNMAPHSQPLNSLKK